MNLAWGGVVLIVLLLPGFLFFVGFYLPERFTRQLAERSALGHLGGAVLVALLVHSSLYLVNEGNCTTECIRLDYLIEFITLSQPSPGQLDRLVPSIGRHVLPIAGYLLFSGVSGIVLGGMTGWLVVKGPLRRLAQHTWVYGLLIAEPDGWSVLRERIVKAYPWSARLWLVGRWFVTTGFQEISLAYVLTRTEHNGRVLLYKGFLKAFGIRSDGTFTYLVLVQPHRLYLELEENAPKTTMSDAVHQIASTAWTTEDGITPSFYVDGSQIANVFFDRERLPNPGSTMEFRAIVEAQQEALEGKTLSDQGAAASA